MDYGAIALRVNVQYFDLQVPVSVGLGFVGAGGGDSAAFGFYVFFGAILDDVGEGLARMQSWEQTGARGAGMDKEGGSDDDKNGGQ